MLKIFDAHTHTYPDAIAAKACESLGKFYEFNVEGAGTYNDLESRSKDINIGGFLLFSVATNAHQVEKVNSTIAALVETSRSHGLKTVGFAGIHQDFPDFEGEIERSYALGLRGVKIHPDIQGVDINDKRLYPLYEILEAKHMPLYLHMGDNRAQYRFSSADKLVAILKDFPALSVIAAHLGGYKAWDESLPLLAGKNNVMYDTSSALWILTKEKARNIIYKLGVENVMYGTDYPVVDPASEFKRFMALDLTDRERENILWNNAARLLNLGE